MRSVRFLLVLLLVPFACGPGATSEPAQDARTWRALAEELVPEAETALLDDFDPMGDWKVALASGDDWSLLSVTPEARGTWRLGLRRSAWSEATVQVLSEQRDGVLVLSHALELAPGESAQAFFVVLVGGQELLVPDTRLALLADSKREQWPELRAGFRRVVPGGSGAPRAAPSSSPYGG